MCASSAQVPSPPVPGAAPRPTRTSTLCQPPQSPSQPSGLKCSLHTRSVCAHDTETCPTHSAPREPTNSPRYCARTSQAPVLPVLPAAAAAAVAAVVDPKKPPVLPAETHPTAVAALLATLLTTTQVRARVSLIPQQSRHCWLNIKQKTAVLQPHRRQLLLSQELSRNPKP